MNADIYGGRKSEHKSGVRKNINFRLLSSRLKMFTSAEEFVALRSSSIKSEYDRAATEEAPISVWRDVIKNTQTPGDGFRIIKVSR